MCQSRYLDTPTPPPPEKILCFKAPESPDFKFMAFRPFDIQVHLKALVLLEYLTSASRCFSELVSERLLKGKEDKEPCKMLTLSLRGNSVYIWSFSSLCLPIVVMELIRMGGKACGNKCWPIAWGNCGAQILRF